MPNRISILLLLSSLALWVSGPAKAPAGEPVRYDGRWYVVYSDAPANQAYEAIRRLETACEEFARQTGATLNDQAPPDRLPFYLYARHEDFADGLEPDRADSAGCYSGRELRATLDVDRFGSDGVWHVIQHEAWHQFAHRILGAGRDLPLWINEGLAEYFGQGLWTGDGLVTGILAVGPDRASRTSAGLHLDRLRRIQLRLRAGQFRSLEDLLALTAEQWNRELAVVNYDQVLSWALYFLHADGGKYREALAGYLRDVARGRPNEPVFRKHFGRDFETLEQAYRQWWLDRKVADFAVLHDRAAAETLMSFLLRAERAGLRFDNATDFLAAARRGDLDLDPRTERRSWLPSDLLGRALRQAERHTGWSLRRDDSDRPVLTLRRDDGTVLRTVGSADRPPSADDNAPRRFRTETTLQRP